MTQGDAMQTLGVVFGRLFESGFATLEGIAVSRRVKGGMAYVDGLAALQLWLDDRVTPELGGAADPVVVALHEACYENAPDHEAVISGWSRHLRALLLEGHPAPPVTSMLRNRGVADLAAHVVEPSALIGETLFGTLAHARALAERSGMRHHLLITSAGYVLASGAPPHEVMAHWHNVEMAARVECLRLADAERAWEAQDGC